MLCSAPAGKSGSNWLDRLRSIKGIPTGDDLDLDSFLSNYNSDHTTIVPRNRSRIPELPESDPTPISTLLADLFNIGGSLSRTSNTTGKKCPRKQTNPKSFVVSSLSSTNRIHCAPNDHNSSVPCTNFNLSSSNNNFVSGIGTKQDEDVEENDDDEEKEKESGGWNELKGFSKSEVTVIDTSSSEWKSDKFVFRKNNVWKVRDKKTKSKFLGNKNKNKSKGSSGSDNNKELQFLESSNLDTNMQHSVAPTIQGQNTKQEMKDVNNEDSPEDHEPKPPFKKRFNFPGHLRNQRRKTYVSL